MYVWNFCSCDNESRLHPIPTAEGDSNFRRASGLAPGQVLRGQRAEHMACLTWTARFGGERNHKSLEV